MGAHAAATEATKDFEENYQQYTEQMALAFAEGDLMVDSSAEEIAKYATEVIGVNADLANAWAQQLEGNTENIAEFGKTVLAAKQETDAYNTQLAMMAAENVDTTDMTNQQKNIVNAATQGDAMANILASTEKEIQAEIDEAGKYGYDEWAKEQAIELYGTDKISVDDKGNVTVGEGNEKKTYTKEEFQTQLLGARSNDKMTDVLQKLPYEIEQVSKKFGETASKAYVKVFEKNEGRGLTQTDLEQLTKISDDDLIKQFNNSPALQSMYSSADEYVQYIRESTRMANDRFDVAFESLREQGIDVTQFNKNITSEAAEGYAEGLNIVLSQSGSEAVKAVDDMVGAFTEGLSEEEVQSFYTALSGTDWLSTESWDNFGTVIENLGLNIPTDKIEAFTEDLKGFAGAIDKLDLSTVIATATTLAGELQKIRENNKKTISEEAYTELTKDRPELKDKFSKTLEGEYFYEGTFDELQNLLQKYTITKPEEELKQNSQKLKAIDIADSEMAEAEDVERELDQTFAVKDFAYQAPDEVVREVYQKYAEGMGLGDTSDFSTEVIRYNLSNLLANPEDARGVGRYLWKDILGGEIEEYELYNGRTAEYEKHYRLAGNSNYSYKYTEDVSATGFEEAKNSKDFALQAQWLKNYAEDLKANGINITDVSKTLATGEITEDNIDTIYTEIGETINSQENLETQKEEAIQAMAGMYATESTGFILEKIASSDVDISEAGRQALGIVAEQTGLNAQADEYATINNEIRKLEEEGKTNGEEYNALLEKRAQLENNLASSSQIVVLNEKLAESFEGLTDAVRNYYKAGTEVEKLAWAQMLGNKFGINVNTENEEDFMGKLRNMVNNPTSINAVSRLFALEFGDDTVKRMFHGENLWQADMEAANKLVEKGFGSLQTYTDETGNQITKFVPNLAAIGDAVREAAEGLESAYSKINSLQINSEAYLRRRERNKKNYDRAVESGKGYTAISNLYEQQRAELSSSNQSLSQNLYQMGMDLSNKIMANRLSKYVSYDFNQKDILFTEKWFALSEEERTAYEGILEEIYSDLSDIQSFDSQIAQNTEDMAELEKELVAAEAEMTERTRQMLIDERQKQIDALSSINDSINEAQEKLVSKMQEQIDDARQARENEKTERELADKETRLAYLRANSAGNELEILQLEKELADEQENYTDSLVDQALDRLTDANAEAAEQRERQITILEEQLKAYEESAESWMEAQTLVTSAALEMASGTKFEDTELGQRLYNAEVKDKNMNPIEIQDYINSTTGAMGQAAKSIFNSLEQEATWAKEGKFVPGSSRSGLLTGYYVTETTWGELVPTLKAYKTGGLADFTGPAWLDGTKSRPEIVLNAKDSANFIVLRDILSDLMSGSSTQLNKENGDNYFDIDINVESLGEDYDVDKVADRIREIIYEDSMYRNVTAVNTLR